MKTNKSNFFWPSYTDLMTSLFFIMLVLFVLSFAGIQVTLEKAKTIEEIEKTAKSFKTSSIVYDSVNKFFLLKQQVQFSLGSSEIPSWDTCFLHDAGNELVSIINISRQDTTLNIKYLVVIEGTASRTPDSRKMNDVLSYERALAIKNYWESSDIKFDTNSTQLMVVGSGFEGTFRSKNETENQRIIIQIIPKYKTSE